MPLMTNQQRIAFLQHVHAMIFSIRFPLDVQPGSPRFQELVPLFENRVKQLQLDPQWSQWVIENPPVARTFKCAEIGAYILVGFDVTLNLGDKHIKLRILEQNPHKKDTVGRLKETAKLARMGHRVAWVIDRTDANNNKFLGSIRDGVWTPNRPRAYENVTPMRNIGASRVEPATGQDQYGSGYQHDEDWLNDVPNIDPNDIPIGIV